MHKVVDLPILYFGTPVILISTLNEDGSINIAPSSSIWWLGKSCMIGLDGSSKTTANLKRTKECVINLPSAGVVGAVNNIANTTGSKTVPLHKKMWGYRYLKDKIGAAGVTVDASLAVAPPRIVECQIQLEASVDNIHRFANSSLVPMFAFEMTVLHSHIDESILMGDQQQYVNPDAWHPLIMSFRKFYTTHENIYPSRLEQAVSVEAYRARELTGLAGKLVSGAFRMLNRKYIKV